jgi:hypothetical protein
LSPAFDRDPSGRKLGDDDGVSFSQTRTGVAQHRHGARGDGGDHKLAGRPAIVEIMFNPDGRLWIDRLAGGLSDTGMRLSAQDGERIVGVVGHHVGAEVHPGSPRISVAARTWNALPTRSYALEHRWLYERIETAAVIPHMLEAFVVGPP